MRKILGCLVVLLALGYAAEVVTFEDNWASNPLFNVVHETPMGLELVFSTQQLVIEEQSIDGVVMKSFGVPGVFIAEPGAPNLSGISRYVALPQGARAQVVILDVRTEVYHNVEVAPASNIPLDNDDTPLFYEKDISIYGRNAYWPSSPVQISTPMKMRGVDVVLVGVMPFQYNPVTKELIVYKDLRFRVDFVGGTGHFGEDRLRSRFWEPILQGHLLNYTSLPKIDFYTAERFSDQSGFEYIIIVPDDALFEQWADTIKAWRKLQGISCDVYNLTEIGGTSATAIENFLNNAYNTWTVPPVAFLILSDYPSSGDVYGVTSPIVDGYASDNKYADVDGDTLPDMFHARIAAQTATHLDRMVNKFLSYERSPYTAANYYDEPLIACGYQTERWFQLCSETVREFMINEFGKNPARQYNIYSGTPVVGGPWSTRQGTAPVVQYWYNLGWLPSLTNPYDAAWWNNGSPAGITGAINSGCFLLQHRDHGYEGGWGEPAYGMADLDNLTNTMYTYVYSINCLTGKYQNSTEVFCEKFHRIVYGALGFMAPTEVSYSFVNDTYIWGTYDALWSQFDPGYPFFDMTGYQNQRPGMAMVSAKYYLFASWMPDSAGLGMNYKVTTAQLFHDHGDVFWTMYSVIPMTLTVSHPATLLAGATTFNVSANDSSVIALTVNGEIIGVAEGTGSSVPITIPPQTPGNTMKVTITKANYYRYEVDVPVTSSTYPYVTLSGTVIDDNAGGNNDGIVNPGESINYGVYGKNVGTGTALSVYGLLFESDTYVTLTTDSSWYGNIPEDDSSLSNPYYGFDVATNCPDGHVINFTLDFQDVNDSVFTSYPSVTVYAPILTFIDVAVVNDGNGNGILDPAEDADLVVTLENEGGATASSITSTLSTSSSYITINDASGNFGSIDPGNQGDNSADPYHVTASGSTPTGTICNFEVEVVSGIYVDTFNFSIVVGKKHYYIWNPDPTPTPGADCHTMLGNLGYAGDYGTTLASDLTLYQTVLVFVGIYSNNYVINSGSAEATALNDFVQNQGGRMYLEGGDVWYYDPLYGGHDFGPLFGINATADGSSDGGPYAGQTSTFTTGMNFAYGGQNSWMDHISATGTGFLIFYDTNNSYDAGVANDAGTYRTVGCSFELGGLTDASPPSTRSALLDSIMKFFGIIIPGVEEGTEITGIPLKTMLSALYPNPGIRVMSMRYQISSASDVSLCVYDAAGRLVRTVASGKCEPGYYTQVWDVCDAQGRRVPAGVYFVRFEADDYQRTEKAVLLK